MVSRSAARLLVFFIGLSFAACGAAGIDESNLVTELSMRNDNQAPTLRQTHEQEPFLPARVVRIRDGD